MPSRRKTKGDNSEPFLRSMAVLLGCVFRCFFGEIGLLSLPFGCNESFCFDSSNDVLFLVGTDEKTFSFVGIYFSVSTMASNSSEIELLRSLNVHEFMLL